MAWTSLSFSYGSILTSAKITQLYDNLTAVANGDSGAPNIQTAGIAASAVTQAKVASSAIGQAQCKSTTASGSVVVGAGVNTSYTLTGGTYSWWIGSADTSGAGYVVFGNGDTAAGVIGLHNPAGALATFYANERYIQASPPYNLGYGDIPLFCYVAIDSLGKITRVQIAPDPPWAYHGPTNIAAQRIGADGKAYRKYPSIDGVPLSAAVADKGLFAQYLQGNKAISMVEQEITHTIKNADMPLHPHPFAGCTDTVVLIDPLSSFVKRMAEMHENLGASFVRDLFNNNKVNILNTPIDCVTPNGVLTVRANLK